MLGTPLGHADHVETQLRERLDDHQLLLNRIPEVPDLQSAWALLPHCKVARNGMMSGPPSTIINASNIDFREMRSNAPMPSHCCPRIIFGQCLENVRNALRSCTCRQSTLIRCSGCFHHITHLLTPISGGCRPPRSPHSSAGFLESGDSFFPT